MQYRFVTGKQNYEDYAAGRVILSRNTSTSFPIRLASEIFQRCTRLLPDDTQIRVYDPCCGSAYLLTILGFLHSNKIKALYGSDIHPESVKFASDNLKLLTHEGLAARRKTIQRLTIAYNKTSHYEALNSVDRLAEKIPFKPIDCAIWQTNALTQTARSLSVDLIICDVPYGDLTAWQNVTDNTDPLMHLLTAQYDVLREGGIFALISDKKQRAIHPHYAQMQHETIGKRRFVILQKN